MIIGFKCDKGSKLPGASLAPVKYVETSQVYSNKLEKLLLIDDISNLSDEEVEDELKCSIRNNNISLAIGGDHSISYVLGKTLRRKNSCLIIFDAHIDYFPNCSKKIKNWNFIEYTLEFYEKVIVLGSRNYEFKGREGSNSKIKVISSHEIFENIEEVIKVVYEEVEGIQSIYLSIDMDVLDPAFFNSVSYPLIGGITMNELLYFLRLIFGTKKVYFCDIVEYNPMVGDDNSYYFYQFVYYCRMLMEKSHIE